MIKKLIYISISFLLMAFVVLTFISYERGGTSKFLAPPEIIKVDAKKNGLHITEFTLPARFTVDGVEIQADRREIKYPDKLPILYIKEEELGERNISRWFKPRKIDFLGETTATTDPTSLAFTESRWAIEGAENGYVTIGSLGSLTFTRNPQFSDQPFDVTKIKEDELRAQATSYVEKHGGTPSDAEIEAVWTGLRRRSGPGKYRNAPSIPSSHYAEIRYRHSYKGIPINDDVIAVTLNHGVNEYVRRWHTITPGPKSKIITPRAAVESVIRADKTRIKGQGAISTYGIRLVYFDPKLHDPTTASEKPVLRPGWVIGLKERTEYLVDAFNGGVYEFHVIGLNSYSSTLMYELY